MRGSCLLSGHVRVFFPFRLTERTLMPLLSLSELLRALDPSALRPAAAITLVLLLTALALVYVFRRSRRRTSRRPSRRQSATPQQQPG